MATKAEHVTALKSQHSSLTKNVNGVNVTLSSSEYDATIDEWATANAATDVRNALIASGGASADYANLRTDPLIAGSYPSIADQLDKLYHDIDDGKLDKTGSWYLAIKATKDKYTKPS
tara:strand:- start:372 stop:725 length:354 start_codon:yes stop_codon:yes gene_type:complete